MRSTLDYPANGGDNDDNESSDDDNDDDDDVENDGEDDEEVEHLAPVDPFVVPIDDHVEENASNKRKWEGNHNGSSSQQNKRNKVHRAHTAWPINKKAYAGSLPLCNQCKFYHN
nr:hypothetical protein [Tanacetum cinerariifolium]